MSIFKILFFLLLFNTVLPAYAMQNVCCHQCRISKNRVKKKPVKYMPCSICEKKVYCMCCIIKVYDDYDKKEQFVCKPCQNDCCCNYKVCARDHRHCFTYKRTLKRHQVKLKWVKDKPEDDRDIAAKFSTDSSSKSESSSNSESEGCECETDSDEMASEDQLEDRQEDQSLDQDFSVSEQESSSPKEIIKIESPSKKRSRSQMKESSEDSSYVENTFPEDSCYEEPKRTNKNVALENPRKKIKKEEIEQPESWPDEIFTAEVVAAVPELFFQPIEPELKPRRSTYCHCLRCLSIRRYNSIFFSSKPRLL